jgi:hypothetical protein
VVDTIEPSLPFWQERLGFQRPVELADGDRLGFVILTNGPVEVMYQTQAMLKKDSSVHGKSFNNDKSYLFVEIKDIDALEEALKGFEIIMPRRQTFYGSTETGYREPGGHFVTFAQFTR